MNRPLLIGSSGAALFAVIALVWAARPAPSACNAPLEFSQSTRSGREWQADWARLEAIQAKLPDMPTSSLELPVTGRLRDFPQTYGRRNWGAIHYGQDFVVPVGTPVRVVTDGVLWRVGFQAVGGLELYIVGAGDATITRTSRRSRTACKAASASKLGNYWSIPAAPAWRTASRTCISACSRGRDNQL